jgi:hypothetical protein
VKRAGFCGPESCMRSLRYVPMPCVQKQGTERPVNMLLALAKHQYFFCCRVAGLPVAGVDRLTRGQMLVEGPCRYTVSRSLLFNVTRSMKSRPMLCCSLAGRLMHA